MAKRRTNKIPSAKSKVSSTIPENHKNPVQETNGFSFYSVYPNWIKGIEYSSRGADFVNYTNSSEEFSRNMTEIITEFIPKLYDEYDSLFNNHSRAYNCHPVSDDKINFVMEIAENIHQTEFSLEQLKEARYQWWYLGFKQSVRLVGLYNFGEKAFYPIFIDHHHLLHADINYNQPDYSKYSYCPIEEYKKK